MKTIKDYLAKARKETNTSVHQLSDAELLDFLNRRRNELVNELITKVNEDFFYEIFTTDLVAGQNEYSLQKCSPEQEGMKKIISLEIKSREDSPYTLIPKKGMNTLGLSLDELNNMSESQTFFDIKDSSIFLYPTPKQTIENGIRGQTITSVRDLQLTDNEEAIFPGHSDLRDFYELIYIGAKIDCRDVKQDFDKKNLALNDYEMTKRKMLSYLSDRYNSPAEFQAPTLDYYKY